jgi:hypothetical protein
MKVLLVALLLLPLGMARAGGGEDVGTLPRHTGAPGATVTSTTFAAPTTLGAQGALVRVVTEPTIYGLEPGPAVAARVPPVMKTSWPWRDNPQVTNTVETPRSGNESASNQAQRHATNVAALMAVFPPPDPPQ